MFGKKDDDNDVLIGLSDDGNLDYNPFGLNEMLGLFGEKSFGEDNCFQGVDLGYGGISEFPDSAMTITPERKEAVEKIQGANENIENEMSDETQKLCTYYVKPARSKEFKVQFSPVFPDWVRVKPSKYTLVLVPEDHCDLKNMNIQPAIRIEGKNFHFYGQGIAEIDEVNNRRVKGQFGGTCLKFNVQLTLTNVKEFNRKENKIQLVLFDQNSGIILIETNYFKCVSRKNDNELEFWKSTVLRNYQKKTGKKRKREEMSSPNKKRRL